MSLDLCLALIGPNKKYGSSVVLLFEPLQNVAHGHFLGTPDRSWPDLIKLASKLAQNCGSGLFLD